MLEYIYTVPFCSPFRNWDSWWFSSGWPFSQCPGTCVVKSLPEKGLILHFILRRAYRYSILTCSVIFRLIWHSVEAQLRLHVQYIYYLEGYRVFRTGNCDLSLKVECNNVTRYSVFIEHSRCYFMTKQWTTDILFLQISTPTLHLLASWIVQLYFLGLPSPCISFQYTLPFKNLRHANA